MPTEHLKHESNGRTFKVTQDGQDTGQRVYKSFIGQKNVDLGSGNFAPYVWDEPSQSIRYSNKVCEFDVDGFQTVREFGSPETLIDDQRFELQYWRTQGGGSWRVIDLWQIGLTVNQQDDYCIVTRNLSDDLGNTLDVDFLFKPQEKVRNTFRLHVVDTELTYRIRFQNTGIVGEVTELACIDKQGNHGVYKLRFDVIEFQWNKDEIDLHSYTIESQAGGKKLDIFISDFVLDVNGNVVISPDQWGETGVSANADDCCEGSVTGVLFDFTNDFDSDGGPVGETNYFTADQAWDYSCRFLNVTIVGNPTSVDAGTQLEFDCGYDDFGSWTPVLYGLEGDIDIFSTTAPSVATRTAASHSFSNPGAGTDIVLDGATFQAVVKEILDTSWTSGFDLGLTIDEGNAGSEDYFQIDDDTTGTGARLTIVYTPAAGGIPIPVVMHHLTKNIGV